MKTFHGDAYGKIEETYQSICSNNAKGLELFLKLKDQKNDPNDYDVKQLISEHVEDIQVYDNYTKLQATYPDAIWIYTKEHPLNVESAQFVNENEPLMKLTQEFFIATKNTLPGQYQAFGLNEADRTRVDAELNERKSLLLEYLGVINTKPEAEEEKPKVEAYTIDPAENKATYLDNELNNTDKVFTIDENTWGEYVSHISYCMKNKICINNDFRLIHGNKYLVNRCYKEMGFDGGVTIKSIYEIKRDSPLRQYVDVCNTARRFAETEYAKAYDYYASQGVLKPYHTELSLIDCLYIVSHVEMLKKKEQELNS